MKDGQTDQSKSKSKERKKKKQEFGFRRTGERKEKEKKKGCTPKGERNSMSYPYSRPLYPSYCMILVVETKYIA